MTKRDDELRGSLERQVARRRRFRPAGPIGLLLTGGTVGLLFIVPLLIGAYLGRWLDSLATAYSARWTVSLIVLGVVIGGYNVYGFLKGLGS
jgi:ATP synthase protein I